MSNFKYCPICGEKRRDDSRHCFNCDFEFLTGRYVKSEDESSELSLKKDLESKIQHEKISQDEFVEANDLMKRSRDKINCIIANYLNNALTNQFNENYNEFISISLVEYISQNIDLEFDEILSGNDKNDSLLSLLENLENSLDEDDFTLSKNNFIQWIDENRGHLPGFVLNQYRAPIDMNINYLNQIIDLDLEKNDDNNRFFKLVNSYLDSENEFSRRLI